MRLFLGPANEEGRTCRPHTQKGGTSAEENFGGGISFFRLVPKFPPGSFFFMQSGPFLAPQVAATVFLLQGGTGASVLHVRISLCAGAYPKRILLCILRIPKGTFAHSGRTARAQRAHGGHPGTPLQTTPLQREAWSIQNSIGGAEFRPLGPAATGGGNQPPFRTAHGAPPKNDYVCPVRVPKEPFHGSAAYPKNCDSRNCTPGTRIWGCRDFPWAKKPPPPGRMGTDSTYSSWFAHWCHGWG